MSGSFDAERHLRLAGERQLLDAGRRATTLPLQLGEIAGALVAVQALDEEVAREIVEDYGTALALRGGGGLPVVARPRLQASGPAGPPTAARIAACDAVVDVGGSKVTVLFASLRPDSAALAVVWSLDPGPGGGFGPTMRRHMVRGAGVPGVRLTDDRGTTRLAGFSGGGSPAKQRGELRTDQPLAVNTEWIEVDGHRVALVDRPPPARVALETLQGSSPAEAHLWSRLASGRHGPHGGPFPPQVDVAIETLVAAGALEPDDPLVGEVRAVLGAFSGQPLQGAVREPWQSLLASHWRAATRSCVVPAGVVTPAIGGVTVALDAVVLAEGEMEVHVRTSDPPGHPWVADVIPVGPRLVWWAEDELGNHYLGAPSRWSGGPQGASGVVSFWPSVDDRVRRLRLTPTAGRERAVVDVALPDKGVALYGKEGDR